MTWIHLVMTQMRTVKYSCMESIVTVLSLLTAFVLIIIMLKESIMPQGLFTQLSRHNLI